MAKSEGKPEIGQDGRVDSNSSATIASFLNGKHALKRLQAVAKDFMQPEEMIRLCLIAAQRNPDLLKCPPLSFLSALMMAAELKIRPGGTMGRGYLVPRRNKNTKLTECCFDPGWRGLIDIMTRKGLVLRVEAHVIYENDTCEVVFGTESPRILHRPILRGARGIIVGAYAIMWMKDGSPQTEYLHEEDLIDIRNASPTVSADTPWEKWKGEMSRKSAVKRLSKYAPYDPHLDLARRLADLADSDAIDVEGFTSALEGEGDVVVTPDGEIVNALPEQTASTTASAVLKDMMQPEAAKVAAGGATSAAAGGGG